MDDPNINSTSQQQSSQISVTPGGVERGAVSVPEVPSPGSVEQTKPIEQSYPEFEAPPGLGNVMQPAPVVDAQVHQDIVNQQAATVPTVIQKEDLKKTADGDIKLSKTWLAKLRLFVIEKLGARGTLPENI